MPATTLARVIRRLAGRPRGGSPQRGVSVEDASRSIDEQQATQQTQRAEDIRMSSEDGTSFQAERTPSGDVVTGSDDSVRAAAAGGLPATSILSGTAGAGGISLNLQFFIIILLVVWAGMGIGTIGVAKLADSGYKKTKGSLPSIR